MKKIKYRDPLELISLRQLRYFSAAMECATFSEAAKSCSISQPALSEQIAGLEATLGFQLFDRSGGRAKPTQPAIKLHQQIAACLGDLQAVLRGSNDRSEELGGLVRIGLVQSYGECWVLPVVRKAQERFPELSVSLRRRSAQALIDGVLRGDFELAVTFDPEPYPELDIAKCFVEPFVAIVNTQSNGESIDLESLSQGKLAVLPSDYKMRRQIDAAFAKEGIKPCIHLESDVLSDLGEAARHGTLTAVLNAIAAVSLDMVDRARPIAASGLHRTAYLIRSRKRYHSIASLYLWDALQQGIPTLPASLVAGDANCGIDAMLQLAPAE
jgi:DNA-binding transcriptional LysR family regulator